MEKKIITKELDDNSTIVWFSKTNNYLVVNPIVANLLNDFENNIDHKKIASNLASHFRDSIEKTTQFVKDTYEKIYIKNTDFDNTIKEEKKISNNLPVFNISKYYQINNLIFKVDFQSDFEMYLIHPKFAHLEIEQSENFEHYYQIFTKDNYTSLIINNTFIDSWHIKDIHYFQGKFSMFIVQQIHQKEENEWLGVFHASGIGNDKHSLLLLGDSGNGKSTSLALLQANGLTCLADDFVPVDVKKQHVFTFPSAISIKKNSLETLLPIYPELNNSAEFNFKRLNKIVRYLPPKITDYNTNLPCKNIVFIKYEKDSVLKFNSILKTEAFERLIPDSWISSKTENVSVFLNWFKNLNCYQLTYSNNEKMIITIKNLLNNDI